MRLSKYCVLSTAHLPAAERTAFDALIEASPRCAGRVIVGHEVLSIEPHQFGFAVHLGPFDDLVQRPPQISRTLWGLLTVARTTGADWLSFDRDEEGTPGLPIFVDEPAFPTEMKEGIGGESKTLPRSLRCPGCGTSDVICDASARWDASAGTWVLEDVFDAAYSESCEVDVDQPVGGARLAQTVQNDG